MDVVARTRLDRLRERPLPLGVCALLLASCSIPSALGQGTTTYTPTWTTDAYGNARPVYLGRRYAGIFQNDLQQRLLRGYQNQGRRIDRRGGQRGFALLSDLFRQPRPRRGGIGGGRILQPFGGVATRAQAFQRYGGFERRRGSGQPAGVQDIFSRRDELIRATAFTAPVQRSYLSRGGMISPRTAVESTPFVPGEGTAVERAATGLDAWLASGADRARSRAQRRGWSLLRDEEYRLAARAFEAALGVDPDDAEARLGSIVSQILTGAVRTALVDMAIFLRRSENPFLLPTNLRDALGPQTARGLRVQARLRAGAKESSSDFRALMALVLWYLDDTEEALRVIQGVARDDGGRRYAGLPAKMRAARVARPRTVDEAAP